MFHLVRFGLVWFGSVRSAACKICEEYGTHILAPHTNRTLYWEYCTTLSSRTFHIPLYSYTMIVVCISHSLTEEIASTEYSIKYTTLDGVFDGSIPGSIYHIAYCTCCLIVLLQIVYSIWCWRTRRAYDLCEFCHIVPNLVPNCRPIAANNSVYRGPAGGVAPTLATSLQSVQSDYASINDSILQRQPRRDIYLPRPKALLTPRATSATASASVPKPIKVSHRPE